MDTALYPQLKSQGHRLDARDEKEIRGPKHFLRWQPFIAAPPVLLRPKAYSTCLPLGWRGHPGSRQSQRYSSLAKPVLELTHCSLCGLERQGSWEKLLPP